MKKRGRRRTGDPLQPKSVKLTGYHWALAAKIGNGNATEGIRIALKHHEQKKP